jgi:hypothetical protein
LTRERDNKQRDEKGRQEYWVKWHAEVPDKLSVDPNHPRKPKGGKKDEIRTTGEMKKSPLPKDLEDMEKVPDHERGTEGSVNASNAPEIEIEDELGASIENGTPAVDVLQTVLAQRSVPGVEFLLNTPFDSIATGDFEPDEDEVGGVIQTRAVVVTILATLLQALPQICPCYLPCRSLRPDHPLISVLVLPIHMSDNGSSPHQCRL